MSEGQSIELGVEYKDSRKEVEISYESLKEMAGLAAQIISAEMQEISRSVVDLFGSRRRSVMQLLIVGSLFLTACASEVKAQASEDIYSSAEKPVASQTMSPVERVITATSTFEAIQYESTTTPEGTILPVNFGKENAEIPPEIEIDWSSIATKEQAREAKIRYLSLENVYRMAEKMRGEDALTDRMIDLMYLTNDYHGALSGLEKYIMESNWYKNEIARFGEDKAKISKLDSAIRQYGRIADSYNEPQCVGGAILFGSMKDVDFTIPATQAEHSDKSVDYARQIVPDEIKFGGYSVYSENGYTAKRVRHAADLMEGKMFVTWDTASGHVGMILKRDIVEGKEGYWTIDINKMEDGKMRLYFVNDDNFSVLMGGSVASVW